MAAQDIAREDVLKKIETYRHSIIHLGVGFNTPSVIRFPFEDPARGQGHGRNVFQTDDKARFAGFALPTAAEPPGG